MSVHGPWVDQRGRPLSLSPPVHPSSTHPPTSTPRATAAAISEATRFRTAGSTPWPLWPARPSPDSLRRTRLGGEKRERERLSKNEEKSCRAGSDPSLCRAPPTHNTYRYRGGSPMAPALSAPPDPASGSTVGGRDGVRGRREAAACGAAAGGQHSGGRLGIEQGWRGGGRAWPGAECLARCEVRLRLDMVGDRERVRLSVCPRLVGRGRRRSAPGAATSEV